MNIKSKLEAFFRNNKYMILMFAIMIIYIIVLRHVVGIVPATFEIISITIGIIYLDLLRRQNPLGLVSSILFLAMLICWFASIGLFGQVVTRASMLTINIFGLYFWLHPKGESKELIPSWLSGKFRFCIYSGVLILAAGIAFLYGLKTSMDWTYTSLALIGCAMVSKKKIDAWVMWLIAEIFFGIPLFLMSESWMNILFCIFSASSEIAAITQWNKSKK
jgi:hypothetical protein